MLVYRGGCFYESELAFWKEYNSIPMFWPLILLPWNAGKSVHWEAGFLPAAYAAVSQDLCVYNEFAENGKE